jgi:hypothetical protein
MDVAEHDEYAEPFSPGTEDGMAYQPSGEFLSAESFLRAFVPVRCVSS